VLLSVLFSLLALIVAGSMMQTATGVPSVFPTEHNQNRGKEVMAEFAGIDEVFEPRFVPPPETTEVCEEHRFREAGAEHCSLYWCEVDAGAAPSQEGHCGCYRHDLPPDCGSSGAATVVQRFIGLEALPDSQLEGPIGTYVVSNPGDGVEFLNRSSRAADWRGSELGPLRFETWETGELSLGTMREISVQLRRRSENSSCGWQELCFCSGSLVCRLPEPWRRSPGLSLSEPAPGDGSQRLLEAKMPQAWSVASNMRADVDVVFGLVVSKDSPLLGDADLGGSWRFDPAHEASQPWAQRNMYFFCAELPAELRVTDMHCWIQDFREWVLQLGERFPVPKESFDVLALEFTQRGLVNWAPPRDFLWLRGHQILASYMLFKVDLHRFASTHEAQAGESRWDAYLETYNNGASRFAKGAWHTSQVWVSAQAQRALVSSTVLTLALVLCLSFLGMLAVTCSISLALLVILATCAITSGLAFFITSVMGWVIGPVEVVALIVFLGYAVTYSLHIAHRYGSTEAAESDMELPALAHDGSTEAVRYRRTAFALKSMGGPAMGSAATAAGCSVFLLCCTLTIFQRLGAVVLVVTFLSLLTALGPLPAALLWFGPTSPGRYDRVWLAVRNPKALLTQLQGGLVELRLRATRLRFKVLTSAGTPRRRSSRNETDDESGKGRVPRPPPTPPAAMRSATPRAARRSGTPTSGSAPAPALTPAAASPSPSSARSLPSTAAAGSLAGRRPSERRKRIAEMDLDIGTEAPMDRIWAREVDTGGRARKAATQV